MNLRPILFTLSASLALAACGSEEALPPETPADEAAADTDAGAAVQPAPATPAAPTAANQPAPAAPAAGGFGPRPAAAAIGVAECDSFLIQYERCMRRVPEEQRGGMQSALQAWRGSWTSMKAMPGSEGTLTQACTTAREEARQQFVAYGCAL